MDLLPILIRDTMRRATAIHCRRLRRGLRSLGFISSVAPLLGGFGSLVGLKNALFGCLLMAEGHSIARAILGGASEALVPLALGFAVALMASWIRIYLNHAANHIELEMAVATQEVLRWLAVQQPTTG